MRAIATLGNYDYIISVFFQLDGSMRCQVHHRALLSQQSVDGCQYTFISTNIQCSFTSLCLLVAVFAREVH